jgi:hypothetical protein
VCRALERLLAGPAGASILPEFVSHARPGLQSVRPRPCPNLRLWDLWGFGCAELIEHCSDGGYDRGAEEA